VVGTTTRHRSLGDTLTIAGNRPALREPAHIAGGSNTDSAAWPLGSAVGWVERKQNPSSSPQGTTAVGFAALNPPYETEFLRIALKTSSTFSRDFSNLAQRYLHTSINSFGS
jgi:hypothetical protein